jgi:hypothetical protein
LSPFIEELATQRHIESNRRLIPTQHFPTHAVAAFLPRNSRNLGQQRSSYASTAKRFPYEEVLQEDTGTFPAGIKRIEERIPNRFSVPFRNQAAELLVATRSRP